MPYWSVEIEAETQMRVRVWEGSSAYCERSDDRQHLMTSFCNGVCAQDRT